MNETARMNTGLLLCIIGALITILSVMLGWIDISVTFVDGTQSSLSISGWQVLTEDGASEVIEGTFIPALVIILTIASLAVCIAARYSPKVPMPFAIVAIISIVTIVCSIIFMSINGAVIDNTDGLYPVDGAITSTPWVDSLFSDEISTGRVARGYGGIVSWIGVVILFLGMTQIVNHNPAYKKNR